MGDRPLSEASRSAPFFIVGCPRSGTTLVAQILDSHSRMAVYLETNYYTFFYPSLYLYGSLERRANRMLLLDHVRHVIRSQGVDPPTTDEIDAELDSRSFEGILAALLRIYARRNGKVRAGEKTPAHFRYLDEIQHGFPGSPVIMLMRDPRDTVFSMRKAFGQRIDDAARTWNQAWEALAGASKPVHVVRYEQLVSEPVDQVRALCDVLREEMEPGMLEFFKRIPDHISAIRHLDLGRLTAPVSAGSVGNFRQMSDAEIGLIEGICADGMEAMGYAPTQRGARVPQLSAPPGRLRFVWDRLRYYGLNRERWRRGWARWRMALTLRARYLAIGGPLRSRF